MQVGSYLHDIEKFVGQSQFKTEINTDANNSQERTKHNNWILRQRKGYAERYK